MLARTASLWEPWLGFSKCHTGPRQDAPDPPLYSPKIMRVQPSWCCIDSLNEAWPSLVGSGRSAVAPSWSPTAHWTLVLGQRVMLRCDWLVASYRLGQLLTEMASVCSLLPGPPLQGWASFPAELSWPDLAWPGLAFSGLFWHLLTSPGLSWPDLASPHLSWSHPASTGLTWAYLASSGLLWPLLTSPGLSWPDLASPGLTWLLLASPGLS